MGLLPNVFSDPKLRARQEQLDGQWNSLWATWQSCDGTPDSAFSEFASDRTNWKNFYDGESDWSADSKTATDEWQKKAQEWSGKLASWCGAGAAAGIPSVKDAPPDDPTLIDRTFSIVRKAEDTVIAPFATIGWVAVGFAVLMILAIVWIFTKGRAKGYGIEVGGK